MRFVPIQSLRKDARLGKTLYDESNRVLLQEGVVLSKRYIEQLKTKKINGVYIDDDLSKNIEAVNIISDKLRNEAVMKVKDNFSICESNNSQMKQKYMDNTMRVVEDIVEQILSNDSVLINMVDLKMFDDYTFRHSVNVAIVSVVIGHSLNYDKKRLTKLGLAGILHDIGKVFIPENILNKKGKLTDKEWSEMQKHSIYGYRHLKDNYVGISPLVAVGVLQHHEKYDGSGYPHGKKGDEISEFGRIIAIADVYDALTSDRPYRKAMLPSEAIELIMGSSGSQFDLNIVKKFIKKISPYPLGTIVGLSNGEKAIVVKNYENYGLRPKIKLLKNDEEIELKNDINLTITEVLKE